MENKKLEEMPTQEQLVFADKLGEKVADTLNRATRKVNKLLKQHGYVVTVDVKFCKLKE